MTSISTSVEFIEASHSAICLASLRKYHYHPSPAPALANQSFASRPSDRLYSTTSAVPGPVPEPAFEPLAAPPEAYPPSCLVTLEVVNGHPARSNWPSLEDHSPFHRQPLSRFAAEPLNPYVTSWPGRVLLYPPSPQGLSPSREPGMFTCAQRSRV